MMATRMSELTGATPVDLKALLPRGPSGTERSTSTDTTVARRVELG